MNILIISSTYSPSINGVAISTQRSVNALRKLGHKVYTVIPNFDNSFQEESEKNCYYLPSLPNPYIPNYKLPIPIFSRKLKKWLEKKNIDIVHAHHPFGINILAKSIAKFVHSPLIFTYHTRYGEYASLYMGSLAKNLVDRSVNDFCNKDCDGIVATTESFQKELSKKLDTPVYYASTAGLVKSMKSIKNKAFLRKKLGLSQDKNILLSVSRHAVEKNLDLLIETMSKLDGNKFHLVMVGDGSHNSELRNKVKKLKIGDDVTFVGFVNQDNLKDYYSSSDAFLYSSQTDTIGINILEAMSAGLPVIAVEDESTSEVVLHKVNGYLLPNLVKEFVSHVELLFNDQNLLDQFKKNAKKTARKFMIEKTTKNLVRVYSKVIRNFSEAD